MKLKISNQYKKDLRKVFNSGLRLKSRKIIIGNIIDNLLAGEKLADTACILKVEAELKEL